MGKKLGLAIVALAASLGTTTFAAETGPASPPVAAKKPVTETFFGTAVTDDYRWMEDMKSKEFLDFMKGQSEYTRAVLDKIPGREALEKRIVALDNAGVMIFDVQKYNGKYFYRRSQPGQANYSVVMRDGEHGTEKVLVDPDKLGKDGKHVSIDHFQPSNDGRYLAYGLSEGGSEQSVLHILDTTTGKDLPEQIDRTNYAAVSWLPSSKGFFYLRLNKQAAGEAGTDKYKNPKNYLHMLGTDPDKDSAVLGKGLSPAVTLEEIDFPEVIATPGSDIAVAVIERGVKNEKLVYTAPLDKVTSADAPWTQVATMDDDVTNLALHGHDLYLLSHKDASRFKILKTDAVKPDLKTAQTVVAPSDVVITQLSAASDGLYVVDMDGGPSRLRRLPYGGQVQTISLPYDGAVDSLSTDPRDPGAIFSYEGWVHSRAWNYYDPKASKIEDTGILPPSPVDASAYASEEVTAKSYDGTEVPLSIVHRKDIKLDGSNPALIWGYGAYGISQPPAFAPKWFALLEQGGIWPICHVRGGGEYGEDWHLAGQKLTKPNSWKDLIACAEYLVAKGYTSPGKIGIDGGSAGGILVGRAMTARPDLFRVVIDEVGVSDALRSEFTENGPPNIPEFGSVTTEDGFKSLFEMDAIQHVKPGTAYPAVMLTTGINDPRVPSWESAKMGAVLQADSSSGRPVLVRVDYDAGHGIGSTRVQRDHELADKLAFFFWQTDVPTFQPKP